MRKKGELREKERESETILHLGKWQFKIQLFRPNHSRIGIEDIASIRLYRSDNGEFDTNRVILNGTLTATRFVAGFVHRFQFSEFSLDETRPD